MSDELSQGPESGTGASGRFLHIAGGKIIERTTADNPKAIRRTPKPNDDGTPRPDVYELHYESFSGVIEALRTRERTVEWREDPIKSTVVSLRAGGELYHLEMEEKGRYWPIFCNCLATGKIDFRRGVRIKPWDYERKADGKRIIGLGIYQMATDQQREQAKDPASGITINDDGTVQIPWRWTRDNPGKLPQAVQIMAPNGKPLIINGRPLWSFEDRDNYMRSVVEHYGKILKDTHKASMTEAEKVGQALATGPTYQSVTMHAEPSRAMPAPDLRLQRQQARHAPPLTAEENALPELDRFEEDSDPAPF